MDEEKTELLRSEGTENSSDSSSYGSTTPPFSSASPEKDASALPDDEEDVKPGFRPEEQVPPFFQRSKPLLYIYEHRKIIPGYGVVQLVRKARPYAIYVLFMLLLAYLLNQLDRYTLPIVTSTVGAELRYGDKSCQVNPDVTEAMLNSTGHLNYTDICKADNKTYFWEGQKVKHNESLCTNLSMFIYNGTNETACRWWWDGSGLSYQIIAGPVFNNIYIVAGVLMGFLADYGNRKVFLVISLVCWSIVTGATGFARHYWHLILLRALLAIGAAGCSPFAVSILGDYFPQELRGTAIGFYYWGIYIGYSLAYAIGDGIVEALNWHWVFFLSAIFGLVIAPIILFTVKEPQRQRNPNSDTAADSIDGAVQVTFQERSKAIFREIWTKIKTFISRLWLIAKTFIMPGMLALILAASVRNAGGYVWAYNTELFFENVNGFTRGTINKFMSWIPLVGGSLGAIFGGLISDLLVKNRGVYARIWVLIISQLLAAPFAAGALFLPYPICFLSLIPSNVIGEMWIGVTTAIVVDLAPSKIRTTVIAVYLFLITVVGGNFNFLVPFLEDGFKLHVSDDDSYRWALFLTYPGLYALSSILFFFAFLLMRLDIKRKQRMEAINE